MSVDDADDDDEGVKSADVSLNVSRTAMPDDGVTVNFCVADDVGGILTLSCIDALPVLSLLVCANVHVIMSSVLVNVLSVFAVLSSSTPLVDGESESGVDIVPVVSVNVYTPATPLTLAADRRTALSLLMTSSDDAAVLTVPIVCAVNVSATFVVTTVSV